jgi:outer membrane protein assembly factor BamB
VNRLEGYLDRISHDRYDHGISRTDTHLWPSPGHLIKTGDLSGFDAMSRQVDNVTPYVSSLLIQGNRIYVYSVLGPAMSCREAQTGWALLTEPPLEGLPPWERAGTLYGPDRNGATIALKNADTLEVVSTDKLGDGLNASPAAVGDELGLRGNRCLYCIAKR